MLCGVGRFPTSWFPQRHTRQISGVEPRPHLFPIGHLLLVNDRPLPRFAYLFPRRHGVVETALRVHQIATDTHKQGTLRALHGVDLPHGPTRVINLLAPIGVLHGKPVHDDTKLRIRRNDETMRRPCCFHFRVFFFVVVVFGLGQGGVVNGALDLAVGESVAVELEFAGLDHRGEFGSPHKGVGRGSESRCFGRRQRRSPAV